MVGWSTLVGETPFAEERQENFLAGNNRIQVVETRKLWELLVAW
jgi:hypothetical protein